MSEIPIGWHYVRRTMKMSVTGKSYVKMSTVDFDLVQTACQQHINEQTKHSPEKYEADIHYSVQSSEWKI